MRHTHELTIEEANDILAPLAWNSADPATGTRGNYAGGDLGGYVIATVTRDSGTIDRSNFAVLSADLAGAADIHRTGHWACGWVEWIAIHSTDAGALQEAETLARRLDDYPVLDEWELSNREYEAAHEGWANASIADRILALKRCYGRGKDRRVSVAVLLSARRAPMPEDDNGSLYDYFANGN